MSKIPMPVAWLVSRRDGLFHLFGKVQQDLQRGISFHAVQQDTLDNLQSVAEQAFELCEAIEQHVAEHRRASQEQVGVVLDQWEQLPNDLKSAPGMEALSKALDVLNDVVETAAELKD